MPAGRPTSYSEEMLLKTQEYTGSCKDIEKTEHTAFRVKIPTIEGLAVYLGVNKTTIYEWESNHPEFSNVIDSLRNIQGDRLLNNGLAGTYNPTIAKVLLTKHGYRDAIDTDVTTKGEKVNFNDPKLQEIAKRYEEEFKKSL